MKDPPPPTSTGAYLITKLWLYLDYQATLRKRKWLANLITDRTSPLSYARFQTCITSSTAALQVIVQVLHNHCMNGCSCIEYGESLEYGVDDLHGLMLKSSSLAKDLNAATN